jgi:hypothetical protein
MVGALVQRPHVVLVEGVVIGSPPSAPAAHLIN